MHFEINLCSSIRLIMMDRLIADRYRVLRYLFKVGGYIYCQLCAIKESNKIINAVLYFYGNEEPMQILQMLIEKLDFKPTVSIPNLIFPLTHVEDTYRDQKISLFFLKDLAMPLSDISKELSNMEIMEVLHGALTCLNNLHSRGLVHGRISSSRSYIVKSRHSSDCAFSFNCLDFCYFMSEEESKEIREVLFQSQGLHLGFRASFKDDMESLIYLVTHLLSRGRILTVQRYENDWKSDADLLKWKHCDFFKQMVKLLPKQFMFLIEFYCYINNLGRQEKPDVKYMQNIMDVIHDALGKQPAQSQESIVTPINLQREEIRLDLRYYHARIINSIKQRITVKDRLGECVAKADCTLIIGYIICRETVVQLVREPIMQTGRVEVICASKSSNVYTSLVKSNRMEVAVFVREQAPFWYPLQEIS